MTTDPFSNVKRLSAEVGQPTYVELISIQERKEIAILGPTPNVEQALSSLAFGREPRYVPPARKQGVITPIRRSGIPQKYDLTGPQKSADSYKAERISAEFRSLLLNPFAGSSTIGCAIGDVVCEEPVTDCLIDFGVVLDITGSMGGAIEAVRAAVDTIAGYFETISGGNYRMGLITFGDCDGIPGIQSLVKFPAAGPGGSAACGNIAAFKASLSTVRAGGGRGMPEAGDVAMVQAVDGTGFGPWRDDPAAVKVILFITDASVAGCNDRYDAEDRQRLFDAASAAASCGIKIIAAATPPSTPDVASNLQEIARRTGGIYVATPNSGLGLAELVYSYIFALCGTVAPPPECLGGEDIILNGEFNTDIAGWTEHQPAVSWDSVKKALELQINEGGPNPIARQTVSGLTPGDFITMFFDVLGGTVAGVLTYGFVDGASETYSVPANSDAVRLSINMNVPSSGIITVSFESTSHTFIDNVRLCLIPVTDCGPGTRNSIQNPQFAEGVEFWSDASGNALIPPNDPKWWDSGNDALIVSLSGASEARQSVSGLIVGRSMTFGFTLLSHEPDTIGELELVYGIRDAVGNIILTGTLTNSAIEFPHNVFQSFTVPTTSVTVFFKSGALSGAARIRSVLLCDLTGVCQLGFDRLSFDSFDENVGAWSGGVWTDGKVYIPSGPGLTRTYSAIKPASAFQITIEVLDNKGVIIELASGTATDQFTSPLAPGLYTHSCVVQDTGLVHVTIKSQAASGDGTVVDNILVCKSDPPVCDGSITKLTTKIEWKGIPRRPVNIFNMFARITLRDPSDPLVRTVVNLIPTADGHLGAVAPTSCGTGSTCDFWKQQGNGGSAELSITDTNLTPSNIRAINSGNFASVATRDNWLWSIPANSVGTLQDALITTFPPESVGNVVESVEIFYLANQITPADIPPSSVCPGPFLCGPDPADEFDVVITYQNSLGLNREYRVTVARNSLYPQEVSFAGTPWDTISTLGNGLCGMSARWESVKFELDNTAGTGLDQCTDSLNFIATGNGNLIFSKFDIVSSATFFDPCDAEVIIEEIVKGVKDNEIQSIVLPVPSGGTWDLTVTIAGDSKTATIPWNAGADVVQIRIGRLSNVGHGNVAVTGTGTQSDPFVVEFVGDLGGTDIPLMAADGSFLTGTSSGVVETITNGTKNERQTITVTPGTLFDLIVEFNGVTSIPITYNWSLNQKQGAFWGISTIGDGNVSVTGGTSDRDSPYTGDLAVDFVGTLANNNVPEMTVQPTPNYSVATNWQGGTGVNEKQRIRVMAASGTFTIKFYSPDDLSGATFFITAPLPYNASDAQVKAGLVASGFVTNSDVTVTKSPADPLEPLLNEWTVEFVGSRAATGIRQMEVDSSQLRGGPIAITGVTDGGSSFEKQRVTIKRANGGYFRLKLNINDIIQTSSKITWNTTAAGMQQILEQHPEINPGDIRVVQNANGPDPDVTSRFTVTFKRFGDIPMMIPSFERSLLCDPIVLVPVPPPPYPYPIEPECEIEDLSCQSGPLLSRPCPGDDPLPDELCCDELTVRESANVAVGFLIQRDLFDPNQKTSPRNGTSRKMTIKDITRIKGLDPAKFTPYLRNFTTGRLTETTYSKELMTGLSIILIEKHLDTTRGRSRITSYFASHREILPTRMVWPDGIIATLN